MVRVYFAVAGRVWVSTAGKAGRSSANRAGMTLCVPVDTALVV